MIVLDEKVGQRGRQVVSFVSKQAVVRAAFIFGSQAAGTADEDSDIDIALFIEGVEDWDIARRIRLIVDTQRELGDDLELHLFPANSFESPERASFAAYVKTRGISLAG